MTSSGDEAAALGLGILIVIWLLAVLVSLAIAATIAYFMYAPLSRVPERYRTIEPWTAWLVLVPILGIVMVWILAPFKIPESLRNYFTDQEGDSADRVGDCGKNLGLGWAISVTCMIVPLLNLFAWLVALVFMILYLLKINGLKDQIPEAAQ